MAHGKPAVTLSGCFVASALLVACSSNTAEVLRRHSDLPPFNYVTQDQLRFAMWRLAHDVYELDRTLREEAGVAGYPRERILGLLAGMEEAAASLGPAGWPSNHPQIGANLDRLWRDIEHARRAAEREPPNYFYAGVVSGACLYCHVAGP
jgi:hypothetical protein